MHQFVIDSVLYGMSPRVSITWFVKYLFYTLLKIFNGTQLSILVKTKLIKNIVFYC